MLPAATVGSFAGLLLREWELEDAPALVAAIRESRAHLSRFMPFANEPPASVEETVVRIGDWQARRQAGADAIYGMFLDGTVVGSCGLHPRPGPGGLEIGLWVHTDFTRRGIASSAAILLTDAAFTVRGIDRVEIHHDAANTATAALAEGLGFVLVLDTMRDPVSPGDSGIHWGWRMTPERWAAQRPQPRLRERPHLP